MGAAMVKLLKGGWLDGRCLRRARKEHRCDYFVDRSKVKGCNNIQPGEYYAEGDRFWGSFVPKRFCLFCARYDVEGYPTFFSSRDIGTR